jgi:hypothetical protein
MTCQWVLTSQTFITNFDPVDLMVVSVWSDLPWKMPNLLPKLLKLIYPLF